MYLGEQMYSSSLIIGGETICFKENDSACILLFANLPKYTEISEAKVVRLDDKNIHDAFNNYMIGLNPENNQVSIYSSSNGNLKLCITDIFLPSPASYPKILKCDIVSPNSFVLFKNGKDVFMIKNKVLYLIDNVSL